MSKAFKIMSLTASVLILAGCIIFGIAMSALGWDFGKLSTDKYVFSTHYVAESYTAISVDGSTAAINLIPSEDDTTRVELYDKEEKEYSVFVKSGVLTVEIESRPWYADIGINLEDPMINLYIPEGKYTTLTVKTDTGDVIIPESYSFESIDISADTADVLCSASSDELIKIHTSTGDVKLDGLTAGGIDVTVSTGKIKLTNVISNGAASFKVSTGDIFLTDFSSKSLASTGSTGDVNLKNVLVEGKMEIERTTGDVTLTSSDAESIMIKTDTGDVSGTLLTEKIFSVSTNTGKRDVPNTHSGGLCEIKTTTGDIKIKLTP